jgi:hypothetical protein
MDARHPIGHRARLALALTLLAAIATGCGTNLPTSPTVEVPSTARGQAMAGVETDDHAPMADDDGMSGQQGWAGPSDETEVTDAGDDTVDADDDHNGNRKKPKKPKDHGHNQ